jgi:cell division initiation protein
LSVEADSIDRIRSATFPVARRGYDQRQVDEFLSRVADWLETGGDDRARADLVRRELERIGQKTGRILTDAHEAAEQLHADAENHAERLIRDAEGEAVKVARKARAEAERMIEEAKRRRSEIEKVIADLEERRAQVLGQLERLSKQLLGAMTPAPGESEEAEKAPAE